MCVLPVVFEDSLRTMDVKMDCGSYVYICILLKADAHICMQLHKDHMCLSNHTYLIKAEI